MTTSSQVPVTKWNGNGPVTCDDEIAAEVPVALTYNKRSHVVMMLTPDALRDFAVGFSLTEGIIKQLSELLDVSVIEREQGLELALTVGESCFSRLEKQRRNLVGRTGCGLCGSESLEQALPTPPAVDSQVKVSPEAIQTAVETLDAHQPLQGVTGAVHGAAWCNLTGEIVALREDVGRHNALDKLIGHLHTAGFDRASGFVLVSSRASYEMLYKAAAAGMELLVAVSAPTTLAIDFAHRSGITLVGFARTGRHNVYTFESRIKTS